MTETPSRCALTRMKDLPATRLLAGGTAMCAGCGRLEGLHEFYDVLGANTVFVNAAGCMTLLASYPFTPFRGPWLYTAMAFAPAGAQGVRDALDVLLAQRRLAPEENLKVVVLTGDGAAYGMGLSATSAAIERGLDFLYVCYDNEGHGNTGHHASGTTPHGARTATSGRGWSDTKKDLFEVWAAHKPAYAATVISAEPLDLARKVTKAAALRGSRLILALAPCLTGWDYDPAQTVQVGHLAVKTGIWPLKEYESVRVLHTNAPHPRAPVLNYLKLQGRFRHLFEPRHDIAALAAIQDGVDAYWGAL